jgi:hypothetical protein
MADYERVNHPVHYNKHPSGVECWTIVRHMSFNIGSAMKYLWRNGIKPGEDAVTDLRKAINYINDEIKRLEELDAEPLDRMATAPPATPGQRPDIDHVLERFGGAS